MTALQSMVITRQCVRGVQLIVLACAVGIGSGCGQMTPVDIPPTHPVHGSVTYSDGQPLTNGMIHFQSLENRELSISGLIGADGTFSVETFVVGDRRAGAIAGRYRVTIIPSHPDKPGLPTVIPEPVIIAPGENELQFAIERTNT